MYFTTNAITYHFDTAEQYAETLAWAQSSAMVLSITEDEPGLNLTFQVDSRLA